MTAFGHVTHWDSKLPVLTAAKRYSIPQTTLRDRVDGRIHIDCTVMGRTPILTLDEEAKLVQHLQDVAKYGYGYTRQEVVDIASDYAAILQKRPQNKPLTLNWFNGFIKRWQEMCVVKPRALEFQRAKTASVFKIEAYFDQLEKVLTKYNLNDKPHLIFNVDEKGISQNHTPPYIVGGRDYYPQCVTTGKSKMTTIIGCGSASGMAIPPYFVFAGVRLIPDLMKNASSCVSGDMSQTSWSNAQIFRKYLQQHFIKYIPCREPGQHPLLLLKGHTSYVSIDLVKWAKENDIIMFILPAHTSHILQPMDVACYGPLQKIYNNECHKLMRETPAMVTRYDICSLACKSYSNALSAENLQSAFRKTEVYPLGE
ncbi:uncharacterized protein LOC121381522 [Gigantopelta aegis]|uniref:uncharacterized protein LOC121381522 n=1 Tax=Gigantopelta aegis TaxID=1735272 RepID=UPI001B88DAE9|nr:uncharacterized protein LOC121381522 [Gigantopelta aegis]